MGMNDCGRDAKAEVAVGGRATAVAIVAAPHPSVWAVV